MAESESIKLGVGAVVFRGDEILIIKRAKPPFKGHWSIPGGGLEYGEAVVDAVIREVREETGVEIEITGLLDVFDGLPGHQDSDFTRHVVMIDYICEWRSGEPIAGDDAAEAEFVTIETALVRLSWDTTRQAIARAVTMRQSPPQTLREPS